MSTRYLSIEEINSVLAAIEDKDGIELLQKIRDNINKESDEDRKAEQKFNADRSGLSIEDQQKQSDKIAEKRAFVGYAKGSDIGIKEEGEEDDGKRGLLNTLADKGLLIKGGYVTREGKRTDSYKLTDEGYSLLHLVDRVKGTTKSGGSSGTTTTSSGREQQQQQREQEEESSRTRGRPSSATK